MRYLQQAVQFDSKYKINRLGDLPRYSSKFILIQDELIEVMPLSPFLLISWSQVRIFIYGSSHGMEEEDWQSFKDKWMQLIMIAMKYFTRNRHLRYRHGMILEYSNSWTIHSRGMITWRCQ